MIDPIFEFAAAGADQPEIGHQVAEALQAFGQAAEQLGAQLAEAWAQLTAAIAEACAQLGQRLQAWLAQMPPQLRQLLGLGRRDTMARRKLRRHVRYYLATHRPT